MIATDLGVMRYRDAWARQEAEHESVVAGAEERLLLVKHPPVITFGRRPGAERNLLASEASLSQLGVEVVQSDRGGDITFHGPGQVVAYPIVRLIDHALSVGAYVRRLEEAVVAVLARWGIAGHKDESAIGVWVGEGTAAAKVCALGVRIRKGTSLHGIALNVETDLRYFELIVPCGLVGRPVTSLRKLLGDRTPPIQEVKRAVAEEIAARFSK